MRTREELREALTRARATGELDGLVSMIPYARMLGMTASVIDGDVITKLEGRESSIGNPVLPALHGGAVGALLESAAIFKLLWASDSIGVPKTITLTVDYLRSPRVVETSARAVITRFGRRVANVQVHAFQDDEDRPVARAHAHFLLKPQQD